MKKGPSELGFRQERDTSGGPKLRQCRIRSVSRCSGCINAQGGASVACPAISSPFRYVRSQEPTRPLQLVLLSFLTTSPPGSHGEVALLPDHLPRTLLDILRLLPACAVMLSLRPETSAKANSSSSSQCSRRALAIRCDSSSRPGGSGCSTTQTDSLHAAMYAGSSEAYYAAVEAGSRLA